MKLFDCLCYLNACLWLKSCDNRCPQKPCCCRPIPCPDICLPCHDKDSCVIKVIHSVACVEAALAHILNAEGEKLQKAIEIATGVDELLSVNESIQFTIKKTAEVENTLIQKLKELNDLTRNRR